MTFVRIAFVTILLALLATGCSEPVAEAASGARPIAVEARSVPLDWNDADASVVGRLRFRGGLLLSSDDPRFTELSALMVTADGRGFVSVTDQGYWIRGGLVYDDRGDLTGVADVTLEPLGGPDGRVLRKNTLRDAESLAPAPGGGTVVAFEDVHRLWLYPPDGGRPVAIPPPADLSRAPRNRGVEALTLLSDNRFLVLTEGCTTDGGVVGWVGGEQGWSRVTYATSGGFKPTGATTLPGGDVLVLERRFPPIGARIQRLAKETIVPGAMLEGKEIARLEGSLTVDNMEGIDARAGPGGETLVYVVSDDNDNPLQRTYLLMFELIE
jgi:hypothetical protein